MAESNTSTDILPDKIEELPANTLIQHGSLSDRIYLIRRGNMPAPELAAHLNTLAAQNQYSKIITKINHTELEIFVNLGYTIEAFIPGYFPDSGAMYIVTRYLTSTREKEDNLTVYREVLQTALTKQGTDRRPADINGSIRQCTLEDIENMAELYRRVFPTYPFPISNTQYLHHTMQDAVDYYCIETEGKIVALASAELDYENSAAEMTDFATLPEFRNRGFAFRLLGNIESSTRRKGIQTFFTIARAGSCGINITFAKAGYRFGGRLKNNTNIGGQIESMNIWYKGKTHL